MIDVNDVRCPKCNGPVWDERPNKKNPRGPDFRCKDKTCLDEKGYKTSIWEKDLAKSGAVAAPRAAAPAAKQGYSVPAYVPGLDDGSDALPTEKLDRLFAIYDTCLGHTLAAVVPKMDKSEVGSSPEAVAAVTATLFIAAKEALR